MQTSSNALIGVLFMLFTLNAQPQVDSASTQAPPAQSKPAGLNPQGPISNQRLLLQAQPESGLLFLGCVANADAAKPVLQYSPDLRLWQSTIPIYSLSAPPPPPPITLIKSLKLPSSHHLRVVPLSSTSSPAFFRLLSSESSSNVPPILRVSPHHAPEKSSP